MYFNLEQINMPIDAIPAEKKVIIYGVGEISDRYTELIVKAFGNEKIAYYVISESHSDTMFHGKKILSLKDLQNFSKNNYYYIIASFSAVRSMKNNLLKAEIRRENIHETIDVWSVEVMKEMANTTKKVQFYPQVNTLQQFNYILELINTMESDILTYYIYLDSNFSTEQIKKIPPNVLCLTDRYTSDDCSMTFIWSHFHLFDSSLNNVKHKFCVDKAVSEGATIKLLNTLLSSIYKNKYFEVSKRNFESLDKSFQGKDALIFGSGPSFDTFIKANNDLTSYTKVVCNQIHMSTDAMEKIKPDIYLLYDHIYFMKENSSILNHILDIVLKYDCYLVVPFNYIPILINRKNINKDKLIGIDIYGNNITFISKDNLMVKRMYSVITTLAVPLCSSFSSTVYFVGCDGRAEVDDNTDAWSYAAMLQEEINIIVYDKPSKNDIDLGYIQHCNELQKIISYGESLGKNYYTYTESYIPVLKDRYQQFESKF